MKRYFKIFLTIIKVNIALQFAYRANFYNSLLISGGWGIISIVSIFILTSRTATVYGWTRQELYLLTGIYSIVVGISHMLFSSSFERFARTISLGQLDTYLLQPLDAQFYLSIRTFRPVTIIRIIIGMIFTLFILSSMHVVVNLFLCMFFIVLIFFGVLLLYSLWFLVLTLTIWNPNLSNLVDFLYNFNNLGRYPPALILYTKNVVVFLLLPLTLIASVPARVILGKATWQEIGGLIFVSFGLFFLSRYFWKFALQQYTSASS